MSDDKLITEEEFADLVGWGVDWARRKRRAGEGPPYIRLSGGHGSIRYRMSEVEAWLDEHTHMGPEGADEEVAG